MINNNVMILTQEMAMGVIVHAKLKQDGVVQEDLLSKKVHVAILFLKDQ